jgi:hypothetical protein
MRLADSDSGFILPGKTAANARAAALRAKLERNKVDSVETSIDDGVAAVFRYARS